MYTTILAYVIAVLAFAMIGSEVGGAFLFVQSSRPSNSTEILRDVVWNDLWWLRLGRHSAGFAPTSRNCAHDTAALKFVVTHDKTRELLLDGPRRRESGTIRTRYLMGGGPAVLSAS
jgi:hypothetical protein